MTSTATNTAAIAAALGGTDQLTPQSNRRSLNLKSGGNDRSLEAVPLSSSGEPYDPAMSQARMDTRNDMVPDDEDFTQDEPTRDEDMLGGGSEGVSKARARRASEGARMSKGEGKRVSGELRCEKCGKGYKHSSCLTKHLSVTSDSLTRTWFNCRPTAAPVETVAKRAWRCHMYH